ncbi:vacuolar sorting-associated 13D isoform X1, partial [Brachionus plicatilis]
MLEGLAAWVLKTYIGKYINVNPDKLSIGLLSGVVELENVPLNPDVFNDLNFPFELKTGFFGKIKLNVSLNSLRTSPWLLQAEKLCIKLGPKDYHKTVYKPIDVNQKLNELESKWFKEVELLGLDESKSDKKSVLFKYLTPIAYSLLNNIYVSINELDIRYEDEENNISFGLKIESISIKNDAEAQNIEHLDHSENLSSKLFELKNLSVYSSSFTSDKVDLLIEPTSFKAHLIRDLSQKPLRRRKQARIRIQTQLATLKMNIGQKNLENLCQIIQSFNTYSNYVFNNRFRSACTTRWSLLLKSISYHVKKASWQDLIKWAHDVCGYRRIIEKIYLGHGLDEAWAGEKKRIESEWDYDRLLIIRRAVFEKFVLSEQFISGKRAQPATVKTTMFNYLNFYGIFSKNSKSDPKLEEEVMTLINDTIENDTLLRRDCLLAVLEFKLDQWQINVDQIAKFKLEHTELVIEALPRFDSFLFEMNLSSFYLIDSVNEHTTFFPNLVYPQKVKGPAQVFSLSYEHNPVNSKNSHLTIKSCGFDCVFNRDFYSQLLNFSQNVSVLFQKAGQVLLAKNLKPTKSFSLKTSPIHKITFNFEIIAPKIIMPKEYDNQDSNCLILDFGKLTFKNKDLAIQKNDYWHNDDDYDDSDSDEFVTPVSTPPNEPQDEFDPDLSKYYSNFDLDLNNLQVLSGKLQSNNLTNQLTKGHSDFHLLEKFNISIQLGILMKINPNQQVSFLFNSQLAPVRLMANVKLLKLNIDDFKLINLYETSQLFQNLIQKSDKSKRDKFKLPFRHRNVKKFVEMELKLNEVDITMSVQNAELHQTFGHIDPKSICELKFYMINSLLELNNKFDVDFRLSLYNMLLIDARQIYGPDYQLLAASHEHILFDSSTGSITNQMASEFSRNQKPLICINMMDAEVKNGQKSELKSSVNFRFKRLTGLMFKIEEEDKARKVALFSLDGVLLNLTLAPNDRFLDMSAQVDGFNVTSLLSNSTTVFTIGQLQDKSSTGSFMSRGVFNVDFCKKCIDSQEVKELELRIASLCYLHKPELINELQSCFKDFMRFHEKIMEEVADKAARLALEMLNKGKTYLKDKLARKNSKWIKVKVQLQTPVVGVRLKKTSQYFVAHLGKITIENDIKDHSLTKFSIRLSDMTVFSMFLDRQEIQNLFKLFYNPVKRENLMDKTSIGLSLSYEHKQENALLVIQSVIDNCSITLSKLGLEQLVKISDSLVYDDKTDEIRCESKSRPIDIKNNFKDSSKFEKNGNCVDKSESLNDYEKIFHSISDDQDLEIDGEESLSIQTDVSFKIERLQMDFLADVEKANQHIAELCFKEFELNISKHYQNLTYVSMTLKSMHLIDKLIKSDDKAYLLWSGTSSKLRPDVFNKQLIENLSFSAPSLGKNMNFIKYYRRSKKIKKNDEFLKNIFEMNKFYQCESISLPTELAKPKIQIEKSENFQSKPFGIRMSESASNISSITEENTNPLVKINLIIIDEKNPNFSEKYQKINRFIDIKFSRLKLIVNPETWILVLDVLGLGAKSYPAGSQAKDFDEKKSSTGIKFMVEEFSIELNEDKSYQPLAKLKIDDVRALIESRPEYLNASGQLGSLGIHDVSACQGLYPDKFLTSGDQALKFEFFKHTGPLDHLLGRESFDTSLKLNMNSVKYVHTQRFLSSLTQYFQQFNKLQEALGKMNAISSGEKNISFEPQRSSRIKLDIQTESPIIVIPVNSNSNQVLVFNLGNIEVSNKFESSEKVDSLNLSDFSNSSSANNSLCLNDDQKHCLLDLIEVKFRNTQLYSAERYVLSQNSSPTSDLIFITFGFKNTGTILKTENIIQFHLERNLENEISHRSPDWYVYSKFSSVQLKINLSQYKIIRGLLDQNIGEPTQTELDPAFALTNYADTVTSVNQWKKISLMFDLENVFIELSNEGDKPLASAVFIISSLIFESFSDDTKLVDLVSNEIQIKDTREPSFDVLLKKNLTKRDSQRLQLEVHYKSKKSSNKYSILFNNCRVITIMDWLMEMNNFVKKYENQSVHSSNQVQVPNEVKVNLINTDFVLAEQMSEPQSQAIILRLTAYFEYSELKRDPMDTRLQSFELFTCQMNDIEQTALSIIEPSTLSIALKKRNEFKHMIEMNAQKLRLRFSYLDFKLFIRVIKSVKNQIEVSNKNDGNADHRPLVKNKSSSIDLNDLIVSIDSFSVCIIDDCNDIDIPLGDIQFKKLKLNQIVSSPSHGSVEFALNIDYFNRLLSDWEPLVEPWLAKLFWKSKIASNVLTLTSMDVLNVNLTNPFVNILTETLTNWKKDFDTLAAKNHKVFYPFVLVNSTGQAIQFMKLDADSEWTQLASGSTIQFNFFKKKTLYGQKSHNNQLRNLSRNKIRLKLDDWCEIRPLTVDKVGTYFRDIYPMCGSALTRLIFDISLHQNATKYIEIKSPVTVKNKLDRVLECRIECGKLEPIVLELAKDTEISVPIKYLPCCVSFRPARSNCQFSSSQLNLWECEPGHVEYVPLTCRMQEEKLFHFFARIMRHKFESDEKLGKKFDFIPGHSIEIEPAFSIQNLLPIELRYFFGAFSGRIHSDNVLNFYHVDVAKAVELNLEIDNYHMNKPLEINHNRLLANLVQSNQVPNRKYTVFRRVNFFDENNR